MSKKDTPFKVKIVLGYIIPLLMGFLMMGYFFAYIFPILTTNDSEKDEVFEKVIYLGSTLSALYESELLNVTFMQEPTRKNHEKYIASTEKVYSCLESLQKVTSSSEQQLILKELKELLAQKSKNVFAIIAQVSTETESSIIKQTLSGYHKKAFLDTIPQKIVVKDRVRYDTILPAPVAKKGFLRRVGEVFAPPKNDTATVQTKIVHTITKDTIQAISPAYDTVLKAVGKILDSVSVETMRNKASLGRKMQILLETDRIINTRINLLLSKLQEEAFLATTTDINDKQLLLKKSGTIIFITGVVAVFVLILFMIFTFNDIRKSRLYRRELELARIEAEELMQSREKLLLTISHDIKAPLSSIAGYIELMKSSDLEEDNREYVNSMDNSIGHVMELLNNLLEYSRLEAKKTVLIPEIFPLHRFFNEIVQSFYPLAKQKNIDLKILNDIEPHVFVKQDKLRLRQIITNLLSNALKFTAEGEVLVAASLYTNKGTGRKWLKFSIADTGSGISPEKRDFIFEKFSQVDNSDHAGLSGSGFGLYIVKGMVDLFCGKITVKENNPQGSIFTVQLPIEIVDEPKEKIGKQVIPISLNILVVDDDSSQLKLMKNMLTNMKHSVVMTDNIEMTMKQLDGNHFDLLITDIQLKNETGFELLENLKTSENKYWQQLPVIAVSANSEYNKTQFLEKGFSGFLPKPFHLEELEIEISHVMDLECRSDLSQKSVQNIENTSLKLLDASFKLENLLTMMNNDMESVKQVLQLFIISSEESIEHLRKCLADGNFQEIKFIAHKMLPMFRQLELVELSEILSFLEIYDIENGDEFLFKEKTMKLIEESGNIIQDLKAFVLDEHRGG